MTDKAKKITVVVYWLLALGCAVGVVICCGR